MIDLSGFKTALVKAFVDPYGEGEGLSGLAELIAIGEMEDAIQQYTNGERFDFEAKQELADFFNEKYDEYQDLPGHRQNLCWQAGIIASQINTKEQENKAFDELVKKIVYDRSSYKTADTFLDGISDDLVERGLSTIPNSKKLKEYAVRSIEACGAVRGLERADPLQYEVIEKAHKIIANLTIMEFREEKSDVFCKYEVDPLNGFQPIPK